MVPQIYHVNDIRSYPLQLGIFLFDQFYGVFAILFQFQGISGIFPQPSPIFQKGRKLAYRRIVDIAARIV